MGVTLEPGAEPVPGFRLVARVGRGGCGEVWKAEGPGGFPVAIKAVHLDDPAGPAEVRALELVRDIRHPNLLPAFGSWVVDDHLFLAMELAERTLLDRCREALGQGHPGVPAPEVFDLFLDAALGLDHLNAARHRLPGARVPVGVQHRDVKPQNLLLVGGRVKVADFGLARFLAGTRTGHTGSMTPNYAAPEFFRGATSSRSDQYSLAVTYCSIRGGRLPFTGTPEAVMSGHLRGTPDLSMLPEPEREIVARALAKDPADRWESCRAFAEALRAAGGVHASTPAEPGVGVALPTVAEARPRPAPAWREPLSTVGLGAAAGGTAAGLLSLFALPMLGTWVTSGESVYGPDYVGLLATVLGCALGGAVLGAAGVLVHAWQKGKQR